MTEEEMLLFDGSLFVLISTVSIIVSVVLYENAPDYIKTSGILSALSFVVGLAILNGVFGTIFIFLGSFFVTVDYILKSKAGAP
jgi:cytochrome c biogenesis protein CcdA